MRPTKSTTWFTRFTKWTAHASGRPVTFLLACSVIVAWAALGPYFRFSDSWQLVINTSTTIVTFLMVFLIQSTQNRDSEALQLKLDELIRANEATHNAFLDIEELTERELDQIKAHYKNLAEDARRALRSGQSDLGIAEVNS